MKKLVFTLLFLSSAVCAFSQYDFYSQMWQAGQAMMQQFQAQQQVLMQQAASNAWSNYQSQQSTYNPGNIWSQTNSQTPSTSTSASSTIRDFAYGSHYVIKEFEINGRTIPLEGDFCIIEDYGMMIALGDGNGNIKQMLPFTGLRLLDRKVQENSIDYFFMDEDGVIIGLQMTNQGFTLILKESDKTNIFRGQNRKYGSPTLRMN